MVKSLVVLAAAAAVLSTAGCCWPLHEGRYHRSDRYSDGSRPAPPARPGREDGRDRGYGRPGR